jgi:hypothetical protein
VLINFKQLNRTCNKQYPFELQINSKHVGEKRVQAGTPLCKELHTVRCSMLMASPVHSRFRVNRLKLGYCSFMLTSYTAGLVKPPVNRLANGQ